jgi:hypothetical protein
MLAGVDRQRQVFDQTFELPQVQRFSPVSMSAGGLPAARHRALHSWPEQPFLLFPFQARINKQNKKYQKTGTIFNQQKSSAPGWTPTSLVTSRFDPPNPQL